MTTPSAPLHTLTCPTCGAPLEIKIDEPTIHCQYCNATIENPEYHPPQLVEPPVVIQVDRSFTARPRSKTGCSTIAVVIGLVVLLAVGGGGYFLIKALSSTSTFLGGSLSSLFPLNIESPAIIVSAVGDTPNIVTGDFDVNKDSYGVARLDMTSHKVIWQSLSQKDFLRVDTMMAGDTYVYLVMDTRLVALQLSDGKQAWEATLPDKLPGICKTCVMLVKGQLLVLTTDNSLGAYDALTGHQTWEKHFDNTGDTLSLVGDRVALNYATSGGAALGIFDAATGNETTTIEPVYQPQDGMTDAMETYSNVVFDTSSQPEKAYIFYGFFSAIVERWDLTTGKMDWEYAEADQNMDTGRDNPILLANGELYFVMDNQLRSLDADTGKQMKTVDKTSDYTLVPILVNGSRLIARATRTNGSTRFELWCYDLDSGKNLWKHPLLNSSPIDPPNEMAGLIDKDGSAFTYQLNSDGLWLITFQAQPNQVNLAKVDLDTGDFSSQKSLPLGIGDNTDFYDIPVWITSQVSLSWFVVESQIYAIDPLAGTFPYKWP